MKNNDIRSENKINLLRLLYKKNCSRVELAEKLGLSKSAVTGLIADLEDQNLVVEIGRGVSSEVGGKKPIILSINREAGLLLSIHFNDTILGISIADMMGEILDSEICDIKIYDDATETLKYIADFAQEFITKHSDLVTKKRIVACGISVKGLVDSDNGILIYTSTNPNWKNVPIAQYFSTLFNVYTFVDNDARTVMCLDMFSRLDEDMDVVGCICIDNGVGTGVVIGNNILKGAYFGAVNFAHNVVDPDGPKCKCGKNGCWEAHVSTDALLEKVQTLPGKSEVTIDEIKHQYHEGDEDITNMLLNDYCKWIGIGAANYLGIFNPRRLILYLDLELFDNKLQKRVVDIIRTYENQVTAKSEIRFCSNGPILHLRAAVALALKHFLSTSFHNVLMKEAQNA